MRLRSCHESSWPPFILTPRNQQRWNDGIVVGSLPPSPCPRREDGAVGNTAATSARERDTGKRRAGGARTAARPRATGSTCWTAARRQRPRHHQVPQRRSSHGHDSWHGRLLRPRDRHHDGPPSRGYAALQVAARLPGGPHRLPVDRAGALLPGCLGASTAGTSAGWSRTGRTSCRSWSARASSRTRRWPRRSA